MAAWRVELLPSAERELAKLDEATRADVLDTLEYLREVPVPDEAEELRGHPRRYRIYVGAGYRLVYRVSVKQRKIIVQRIRPRGKAYVGLEKW